MNQNAQISGQRVFNTLTSRVDLRPLFDAGLFKEFQLQKPTIVGFPGEIEDLLNEPTTMQNLAKARLAYLRFQIAQPIFFELLHLDLDWPLDGNHLYLLDEIQKVLMSMTNEIEEAIGYLEDEGQNEQEYEKLTVRNFELQFPSTDGFINISEKLQLIFKVWKPPFLSEDLSSIRLVLQFMPELIVWPIEF